MWAGIIVGLLVIVVLVVVVGISARSAAEHGIERVMRCRAGHLFTSTVIPSASLTAIRLGRWRFQRCPVGRHWTLVTWVDPSTLSPEELASARAHHDVLVP
jgi:hypothetical protein